MQALLTLTHDTTPRFLEAASIFFLIRSVEHSPNAHVHDEALLTFCSNLVLFPFLSFYFAKRFDYVHSSVSADQCRATYPRFQCFQHQSLHPMPTKSRDLFARVADPQTKVCLLNPQAGKALLENGCQRSLLCRQTEAISRSDSVQAQEDPALHLPTCLPICSVNVENQTYYQLD